MKEKKVYVDANEITKGYTLLKEKTNELQEMINKYQEMMNEVKSLYDTPSSKYFMKIADTYINYVKGYIDFNFLTYLNELDNIGKLYSNTISDIESKIQKGGKL